MSFELSTTVRPNSQLLNHANVIVGACPPFYLEETTIRTEITNAEGKTQGFDDLSSGLGYTYTTHYDASLNYLGTEYKSADGSYWVTTRTTTVDANGKVTGYADLTKGGAGDYTYTSTANYDANMVLVSSGYSDSNGQVSTSSQTTQLNSDGSVATHDCEASSTTGTSYYKSSAIYDANWNLIDSSYSDQSGYLSISHRTTEFYASGKITGYLLVGSGGSPGSTQFSSSEKYDANYTLLSSVYSDGTGYQSTYLYETLHDQAGAVTGYRYTSTWTYGTDTQKFVQEYDPSGNLVSSEIPGGTDNGPVKPPICYEAPINLVSDVRKVGGGNSNSANTHTKSSDKAQLLSGKNGDDVYVINNQRDKVIDGGKSGVDSLASSDINLNLSSQNYRGIENGDLLGAKDLAVTGNSKDNQLSGNIGANILDGMYGNDSLFGGAGKDQFRFDTRLDAKHNVDTIVDFEPGVDKIVLSRKIFRAEKVVSTTLTNDFVSGPSVKATETTNHFLYDTATGVLSYDPDGSGPMAQIAFVKLSGIPTLAAGDLVVV